MTTSYKLDAVTKLRHEKAKRRAQEMQDNAKAIMEAQAKKEASDARIAAKQKIIDAGGVVPNPKPVVEVAEKPKKTVAKKSEKKAPAKKAPAKKRGRPAKSKK
jgi:colicin import membrane protein